MAISLPESRFARRALVLALAVLTVLAMQHGIGAVVGKRLLEPISAHAFGWWFALLLAASQLGVGRLLLMVPPLRDAAAAAPAARGPLALGLGLAATTTVLVALGLVGLFGRTTLVLVAVALACAGAWGLWRGSASGTVAGAETGSEGTRLPPWAVALIAAAGVAFAVPYLAQSILPDSDWDCAQYHLPMAVAFLEQGLWTDDYVLGAFFRPANAQVLYSLFFACGAELGIVPFNLLLAAAGGWATWAIAAALFSRAAGVWAVSVYASTNLLLETALDARVEPFLVFCFAVGVLALLAWQRQPDRRGALFAAAWMAGMAAGTKYNGVVVAGVLGAALGVGVCLWRTQPRGSRVAALGVCALFALLPSGVWYARNTVLLGDPMYPFLSGPMSRTPDGELVRIDDPLPMERSPPLDYWLQVKRTWRDNATERRTASRSPILLVDALVHRDRYTTKPLHWVSPFLLLFCALPLFRRSRSAWWLFGIGVGGYLILVATTKELRYLSPLFVPFAAGAGVVLGCARAGWLRAALAVPFVWWMAFEQASAEYRKLWALSPGRYWSGQEDRLGYLGRVGYNGATAAPLAIRWLNQRVEAGDLSPDDGVFMIGEAKGHLLRCRYQPSTSSSGKEWLVEFRAADWDAGRVVQSLRERGYRYILVNYGWMNWDLRNMRARRRHMAKTVQLLEEVRRAHGRSVAPPEVAAHAIDLIEL